MRILHYSLGFPPYRTGGLTKYCVDLLQEQKKLGHEVGVLWPGSMGLRQGRQKIKSKELDGGIKSHELIHPLPVALDEGVIEVEQFMVAGDFDVYIHFLEREKPNIIHFHTFMGIHREFLNAAKQLQIRMVYTTHDYYGLCPKVTFYRRNEICIDDKDCEECVACNATALSISKIKLMQSPLYRIIKNTSLMKKMRQNHRTAFFEGKMGQMDDEVFTNSEKRKEDYQNLRNYYISMFQMINTMHYNSTVTESVYRKYINSVPGRVIDISNKSILNHKCLKDISSKVRLAFLAAPSSIKGYGILRQALDSLWEEGYRNFELHSYGNSTNSEKYLFVYPRYEHEELKQIMDRTDLVIVPSCWYETFGFVVLEALSYGVPVLLSERVGAKDIVELEKSGILVSADIVSLKAELKRLLDSPTERLREMNAYIVKHQKIKTMDVHTEEIIKLYEDTKSV